MIQGVLRRWLVLTCLLPSIAFAQLTITNPVARMVFQRNLLNEASIVVAGMAPSTATLVEARFVPLASGQGQVTTWKRLDFLPNSKAYRGNLTVMAGWYRLDVRAKAGTTLLTESQVNRVGVGEVFVIAGQSNVVGGFEREPGADEDRVSCLDFRQDALDEQLLPLQFSHVSYGSNIGPSQPPHIWGMLGDKLVRRLNVPVLFLGAAQPGSSSDQWRQSAAGNTDQQGRPYPYRRLGVVLQHYIARTGVRAILWHQGEGDVGSSGSTYFDNIQSVIEKSRQQTSFNQLPWVVSRVTYTQGQTNPSVIAAQNRLIANVHDVFAGPSTDDLIGPDNRLGDNVHIGGNGLARFADRWDQSLTADFFDQSVPFTPTDESALITSGYVLPSVRRPGETVQATSVRNDPHEADNQYFVQLLWASDNSLVSESARGTGNPLTITLPANLPNGQYRLRTLSTRPATTGTLGELFRVDNTAQSTSSSTPILPNTRGGTADGTIQRLGYRYEDDSHGFFAMVHATAAVEVRVERIDGGNFSDSDWRPVPPSSQSPDYVDFADYNYIRFYPPTAGGVGGVEPGRYRLSVRRQGDTGAGFWVEATLLRGRNTIFIAQETVQAPPPTLTIADLSPTLLCRGSSFSVAYELDGSMNNGNAYSVRLSDADGSFDKETTIGGGTSSPLSASLSASLPGGNNYRLRLVASNPAISSSPTESLTFCTPVTATADLSLVMRVNNRTPTVGQPVTFTITVVNTGPAQTSDVTVKSLLPAGMVFVSSTSSAISPTAGAVTINAGTMAKGASMPFVFQAKAIQPGSFATTAQVTASSLTDPDSQPGSGNGDGQDDTATVDFRTNGASGPLVVSANPNQTPLPDIQSNQPVPDSAKADLSLDLSASSLTPAKDSLVTATLRVSNRGTKTSDVSVQAELPIGWLLVNRNGLTISGQRVTGFLSAIAAGESAALTLSVKPNGPGKLQTQIMQSSVADSDSTPGNGYQNGEDDEAILILRTRP